MRLESNNPSYFRIEADGAVYAARSLQRPPQHEPALLITAIDGTTQQQWRTQVRMVPPVLPSQEVSTHPTLPPLEWRDGRNRSSTFTLDSSITPPGLRRDASGLTVSASAQQQR